MSANLWQPNPTWWDIETILEQDTRDYKYKSIYLLNDTLPVVHFAGAVAYATSDGKFYTESGCEHVWDVSQDKHCLIDGEVAYSTRYVIIYSNTPTQLLLLGNDVQSNNIIGCIADGISPLAIFAGQQALEFLKIKPYLTKITATAFANCYNLQSVDLPEGLERIVSGADVGSRNLRRSEVPGPV
ncbi:MAG: leucine-rich repeat domain-containing protein, partial [Rikenellaceae bacterium]|nr:leucine-rich repeat domain-containing protein [Rikenellaceae bacterium]